jgi:hypothetical protein
MLRASSAWAQVDGTGTLGTIPIWSGSQTLGDSLIRQLFGGIVVSSDGTRAIFGQGASVGVEGAGADVAVRGIATPVDGTVTGFGVLGVGQTGVFGRSATGWGVYGISPFVGVAGYSEDNVGGGNTIGVFGRAAGRYGYGGVFANTAGGISLSAGTGAAIPTFVVSDNSGSPMVGVYGDLMITGTLTKGSGTFKIDHPLEPAMKYLSHSFVESPDMMNVYNGVVLLNSDGEAWVDLPAYFEALNRDFRYQLTSIGAPGPNLYVAEEVSNNRFKIAGGKEGGKVSWQVTGVRHDAYANAHPVTVEEEKAAGEIGSYLHPELFGQPQSRRIQATQPFPVATSSQAPRPFQN